MYYTKAQFDAREHVNMHTVKVWLNNLWNVMDPETSERVCIPEVSSRPAAMCESELAEMKCSTQQDDDLAWRAY